MADDYVQKTAIVVEVEDHTSAGAKKVEQSVDQMGKKVNASSKVVGEKASKAMSQFNEKTEKGRQLLTTFGGAMGGVAGQAVYYGGTLAYVVGRFKLWEAAAMAGVAAVTALGVGLYKLANEGYPEVLKAAEDYNDELQKLIDSTYDYIDAQNLAAMGLSRTGRKIFKNRAEISKINIQIEDLTRITEKYNKTFLDSKGGVIWSLFSAGSAGEADENIKKFKDRRALLQGLIVDLENLERQEKRRAENEKTRGEMTLGSLIPGLGGFAAQGALDKAVEDSKKKRKKKKDTGKDRSIFDALDSILPSKEAVLERAREIAKAENDAWNKRAQLDKNYYEQADALHQANIDARNERLMKQQAWEKEQAEIALEEERRRQDERVQLAVSVGYQLADVAEALGASEKLQMQLRAAAQAVDDGLKGASATAAAVEAYARDDYASGALYTAAAALYFISATKASTEAAGVGLGGKASSSGRGGGRGGGVGSSNFGGNQSTGREQRETTIIIQGHLLTNAAAGEVLEDLLNKSQNRRNPGAPQTRVT